jgi:hypothetical protein
LQKFEKPQRVAFQAITRYATSCGSGCFCNSAIESAVEIESQDPESITYQHTVFCQIGLPYRDPGVQVREWEREQGAASLLIEAGKAKDPESGRWVELGLPFGPKPRLILCYLNSASLKTGSPVIEVEDSLTGGKAAGIVLNNTPARAHALTMARAALTASRLP